MLAARRSSALPRWRKDSGDNLAALLLNGADAEAVAAARAAYQALQQIYEVDAPDSDHPRLLADLILSQEEDP